MSLGSRRIVPLYVVAALAAVAGPSMPAAAQTVAPPPAADSSAAAPVNPLPGVQAVANETAPPQDAGSEASSAETAAKPASAEAAPASPLVIDVPAALARVPNQNKIDKRDREGLVAAYQARGGRPIWMTAKGATPEALKLAAEIGKAGDWGLTASDFDVPSLMPARDASELAPEAVADAEVRLSLATLKYARHARGGRFEPTDLTSFLDRKSPVYEPATVLEQVSTAAAPDDYLRKLHPQHPEFERLRQRYLAVRDGEKPKGGGPTEAEQLLANMEQWRWMPADLGQFYVWVNIPEQLLRVVRNGRVIHTERVIIGKTNAQTPIFSDTMEQVIFHPFWGLPDSIKTNEVLPSLQKGGAILARQNLRLQLDGKDVDASRFDWTKTDIRRFHIYQPPGSGNVLGVVKFRFPNKHAVYMHDTPTKNLFKSSVRAFSHGCMRVQDPVRLAELILAEDLGMSAERVRALTRKDAPENNQINLTRHVPVHMTYFTAWVDEDGKVSTFKDIYGHEERIRLALAGKMHLVKPVPQPTVPTGPIGRLVEASPSFTEFGFSGTSSTTRPDWAHRMFSGSGSFAAGN